MTMKRDELEVAMGRAREATQRYGQKFGVQAITLVGLGTVEAFDTATRLMDEAVESGEATSDTALYEALGGEPPSADALI